jgi:DHA1 family multidrug resistance protein-like MFS transporter
VRCAISLPQWQRTLIGALIAVFVSILGFNLAFPFLPLFVQTLGVPDPQQAAFWSGLIGSVAGFLGVFVAPMWGAMADRSGRRPMLIRATAGASVGLVMMGLAPNLGMLMLGRTVFGAMAGTVPAANPLVAASTPPEHVASAMGMLQSTVNVSQATGPLIGGVLASAVGYRATFLIVAGLYIASALPVVWLVKERFTPPPQHTPLLRGMAANFRMVFARAELVLPILGAFLAYGGVSVIQPALPLHIAALVHDNHAARAAGLAAGLQGIAATVAALTAGSLVRRLGYRPLLYGGPLLLICAYLALWAAPRYGLLLAGMGLLGFMQGLSVTTLTALIALRAPKENVGGTFGVASSINALAFGGAPFLGGTAASVFGLRAVFPLAALTALLMGVACVRAAAFSPARAAAVTGRGLTRGEGAP